MKYASHRESFFPLPLFSMNTVSLVRSINQILLALIDARVLNTFHFQLASSFEVHDTFSLYLSRLYVRRNEHPCQLVDYTLVQKYHLKYALLLLFFAEVQLFPLLFFVLA